MTTRASPWTMMRVKDAPDDAVGVLVVRDGLMWMGVKRGLAWAEGRGVDVRKLVVSARDIAELIEGKPADYREMAVGVCKGVHPMTLGYCRGGTVAGTVAGQPFGGVPEGEPYDVRLGSGMRIKGTVVIAVEPTPDVADAMGSGSFQPMCFQKARLLQLSVQEFAAIRRDEFGTCPLCHSTDACTCEAPADTGTVQEENRVEHLRGLSTVENLLHDMLMAIQTNGHTITLDPAISDGVPFVISLTPEDLQRAARECALTAKEYAIRRERVLREKGDTC